MPIFNLNTNVSFDGVDTSAILKEVTTTLSQITGKPEAYIMVVLKGSLPVSFGGLEDPAAYGELVSVGGLNPAVNKQIIAALSTIVETKLKVPKNRFGLKFHECEGPFFGWNGDTF